MESLPLGTDVDETLPLEVPEADLANVDGVKKLLHFEDAAVAAAGASTEVAPTVPTTDSGKVGGGVAPIVPTTDSEKGLGLWNTDIHISEASSLSDGVHHGCHIADYSCHSHSLVLITMTVICAFDYPTYSN